MAQFKRDQKIIIFSYSLALTLFQPRGPLGVYTDGRDLPALYSKIFSSFNAFDTVVFPRSV